MSDTPNIDIRPDHLQIVRDILRKHVPQYEVWAFGSRAKWLAKQYSDLDLAIITDQPLSLAVSAALADDFSESDLPWKVDVVDWQTTGESFRKIIERDKVVVKEGKKILAMKGEIDYVPLRDLTTRITKGTTPSRGEGFVSVGINYIKSESITSDGTIDTDKFAYIDKLTHDALARSQLCAGNVLFSMAGAYLGKTAIVQPEHVPANANQAVGIITPDQSKADPRFIHYSIQSPACRSWIKNSSAQSAQPNFNLKEIGDLPIPNFSLEEQRRISGILGAFDDKIELNRRSNQALETLARALFKSWFVDFDGLPPEDMQESELGLIPKGWRVADFSKIVEIIGGGTPKTSVDEYWDGDIPWFSVVDTPAASDLFVTRTEKNITQAGAKESSVRLIPKGATIISARGTVGNLALAGREMTFNQSCYGLRGKYGVGDYFVFLAAQYMVIQLRSMAHGSVFSTITRQTFDAIKIAVPSEKMFQRFEKAVSVWFEKILLNVQQSQTLIQLRDTLLPKLLSGELRVKDAERMAETV